MRRLLFACLLGLVAGCAEGDGQTRFRVTGNVTYDGKPVPFGEVLFTPDGAKGNSGPQGIATIRNGKYDTSGSRAPGVAGGPTIIRVTALTDEKGTLLSEQDFPADLPKADTTHDIEMPAKPAASAGSPEI